MSRYRFVETEKGRYPVTRLCRMAQVSRAAYYQWQEGRGSLRQAADAALTAAIRAIHVASVKDRVTRAPSSFNLPPPSLRFMPSWVSYDVVAASAPTLGVRRPGGNHWGRLWGRLDRFPHAQGFRTPRAGLCGTRNFPQELPLPGSERVRRRSTRRRPVDRFP